MGTGIQWTNETWNPTTGCDRISPGCDNCYALTMAKRLKRMGQAKYQNDGDPRTSGPGFGLTVHEDALDLPYRWRDAEQRRDAEVQARLAAVRARLAAKGGPA